MSEASQSLAGLPYFTGLNQEQMEQVSAAAALHEFAGGEILFLEGEPCRGLYVVSAGEIRIFKSSPEGREQVMLLAGPGDSFNDVPVFDDGPNPASASAVVDSSVYIVPKDTVLSVVADNPATRAVLKMLASRLRRMTLMVEDLSLRTVVSRLARLLLEQAESQGGDAPVKGMTQAEMAAMIGSVRDVVGRALKHLEKDGAIKIKRARIVITRPDRLRELL